MKLYAHPTTPRRNDFYAHTPTPASAYTLERQLLQAYREVLFTWWNIDRLISICFGPRQGKKLAAAENRVQYKVPELVERMEPAELEEAATVFLTSPLPGFIAHVLSKEALIDYRLDEPCNKRLCDDKHARAAGLGKGRWQRGQHTPAPTPCTCHQGPASLPPLVLQLPAPAVATRPASAPAPHSVATLTAQTLLYQVKRAQERRRLKRKRR